MQRISAILVATALVSACTSVQVKPLDASLNITHICIRHNPKVEVSDFVEVLKEGLTRHAISSEVYSGGKLANCEYVMTYTARRSWDVTPYLSHAELQISRNDRQVASATYHLAGKGGLSPSKWANTRSKILPVVDRLFGGRSAEGEE